MRCPKCGEFTIVLDSRERSTDSIRRRRKCLSKKCLHRFTTWELPVEDGDEVGSSVKAKLASRLNHKELDSLLVLLRERIVELKRGDLPMRNNHDPPSPV